jgi:hypothetical protein
MHSVWNDQERAYRHSKRSAMRLQKTATPKLKTLPLIDLCFYRDEHAASFLRSNQKLRCSTQLKDSEGWHILFFCHSGPPPEDMPLPLLDKSSRVIGQWRCASDEMKQRLQMHGLIPSN